MRSGEETIPGAILRALTHKDSPATFAFEGKVREVVAAGAMSRRIAGTATRLIDMRLGRGRIVPFLCPNSADLWSGFVGAMAADLVPTNLPLPTFKTHVPTYLRNLESLLDRYETDTIVASSDVRERLAGSVSREIRWIDSVSLRAESDVHGEVGTTSAVAFLQHSSGSTGVPKGVALTHAAVLEHVTSYADVIGLEPECDVIASWLPLYHDMGLLTSFLLPLIKGVSCRSTQPEAFVLDPLDFLKLMARERATRAWWPNFAFALLADRRSATPDTEWPGIDLSCVRSVVNCSEVVMTSSIDRFAEVFAPDGLHRNAIQASYAMAENVFAVTQTTGAPDRVSVDSSLLEPGKRPIVDARREGSTRDLASSGTRITSVELKVVDENRTELAEGIVGEIAIGGAFLFSEYLRLPKETAASRQEDWYFTRDLGFLWRGALYVLGRESDLIVVGGRKFLANEVERIAASVEGVKAGRMVAFGVRSESKGTEEAVAVVESAAGDDPGRARPIKRAVTQLVLQQMDLALADVRVVAEGALIKTSSGKIARRDNRDAYVKFRGGAA